MSNHMSTEDAIEATYKVLDNVRNTLDRFLGGNVGGESANTSISSTGVGAGFYARYTENSTSSKQQQYAANLLLTKEALNEVKNVMEESAKSTLSSNLKNS